MFAAGLWEFLGSAVPPAVERKRPQTGRAAQDALGLRHVAAQAVLKCHRRAASTAESVVKSDSIELYEGHLYLVPTGPSHPNEVFAFSD